MTKLKMERIGIQKKQGSVVEILKNEILLGNIPSGTENDTKMNWRQVLEYQECRSEKLDPSGISGISRQTAGIIMSEFLSYQKSIFKRFLRCFCRWNRMHFYM